jgi:hypothetical protein
MKLLAISLLLVPFIALGLSVAPNYAKIYEKADVFVEGHLSGKELDKIKVSTGYNSTLGKGHDHFYFKTELIVDGRIQFNGQVIAPDGYLDINGVEKEFYHVYARDGAHLNEGNTKETKAWFLSRSALPRGDSIFCLGSSEIDYAERNVSEYMSKDIESQETSQNIRTKSEYTHGGDLLLTLDEVTKVSIELSESGSLANIHVNLPPENIKYQIRKNPNLQKTNKPQLHAMDIYFEDTLLGRTTSVFISNPANKTETLLRFKVTTQVAPLWDY